jgi:hypothetical protein
MKVELTDDVRGISSRLERDALTPNKHPKNPLKCSAAAQSHTHRRAQKQILPLHVRHKNYKLNFLVRE